MRTLKKTLCLVLCLVMMAGLCVIGTSAAELTDKDTIQHKEAVDVLAALKVLEGYEDGSFRPTNELTRAEGAAIMTRMLGATVVSSSKSSFTDMGNAEWAQPYVAYCEAMGIINGYGDGRFGPQDKLTTAQFAKMLLCALGYNAEREDMVGNAWEIGVAKLVNATALADKIADFNYGANMTRDNAAQMAFNTLTATMVNYKGGLTVDANGNFAAERIQLANTEYDYRRSVGNPGALGTMQFIENYFPSMKVNDVAGTMNDFGEPVDQWYMGKDRQDYTYDKTKKVAETVAGTVLATYTTTANRLNLATLYTDAKWTGAVGEALVVKENKTVFAAPWAPTKNDTATPITTSSGARGYAGATIRLLDTTNNGKGDMLIIEYPYLAKVQKIITAATSTSKNRQAQLKIFNTAGGNTVDYDTEEFAQNDWVLVYPEGLINTTAGWGTAGFGNAGANILTAKKADVVTGNLAKKGLSPVDGVTLTALTLDSTVYNIGAGDFAKSVEANPALNTSVTAYLSNGFILGAAAAVAAASEYVYVLGNNNTGSAFGGAGTWEVGYLKQDATTATAIATAQVVTVPAAAPGEIAWYTMAQTGSRYAFTKAKTNAQHLADASITVWSDEAARLNGDTLKSQQPTIAAAVDTTSGNAIVANANTVFVIKSGVAPATTYKSYTGIKNVPTFTLPAATAVTISALITKSTYAAVIYIDLTGYTPTDADAEPIILLNATPIGERKVAGATYKTYSVIKDGKATTIEDLNNGINATEAPVAGLIIPQFDTNGYLTGQRHAVAAANTKYALVDEYAVAADVAFSAGVLTIEGTAYAVADNMVAYIYNPATRAVTTGDASDLLDKNGTFSVLYTNAGVKKVQTVYLIMA